MDLSSSLKKKKKIEAAHGIDGGLEKITAQRRYSCELDNTGMILHFHGFVLMR